MSTPDVEAFLTEVLGPLGGIKVWAYDSAPMMHAIAEGTSVQIDVRASTKKRARDRAYEARDLLLGLPLAAVELVINAVTIVSGPAWLPDQDGAPRYVLRATLNYHEHHTITSSR